MPKGTPTAGNVWPLLTAPILWSLGRAHDRLDEIDQTLAGGRRGQSQQDRGDGDEHGPF